MQSRLLSVAQSTRRIALVWQFLAAGLIAILALAPQFMLHQVTAAYPFIFSFAACALNGALWRRRVSYAAVFFSAVLVAYFIIEPGGGPFPARPVDRIAILLFVGIAMAEAWFLSALVSALTDRQRVVSELKSTIDRLREAEQATQAVLLDSNHRIKNNLQLLVSLLRTEQRGGRGDLEATLQAAVSKIATIGRLHDHLTRFASSDHVDACEFLTAVCKDIELGFMDGEGRRLQIDCEKILIPSRMATLLGLLVNELVTNALKHAFVDTDKGEVRVTFRRAAGALLLEVEDDGRGMSGGAQGYGRQLIDLLIAQLGAQASVDNGRGTRYRIRLTDGFPIAIAS